MRWTTGMGEEIELTFPSLSSDPPRSGPLTMSFVHVLKKRGNESRCCCAFWEPSHQLSEAVNRLSTAAGGRQQTNAVRYTQYYTLVRDGSLMDGTALSKEELEYNGGTKSLNPESKSRNSSSICHPTYLFSCSWKHKRMA